MRLQTSICPGETHLYVIPYAPLMTESSLATEVAQQSLTMPQKNDPSDYQSLKNEAMAALVLTEEEVLKLQSAGYTTNDEGKA